MENATIKNELSLSNNEPKIDTVKTLIDRMLPQMGTALPKQIGIDRFARVCMTTLRTNPKLLQCSENSLMGALMTASQLGLEPGILQQCYLIPYKGECEFQLGYKGMIELVRRSGELESISANVFYQSEIDSGAFVYSQGTAPEIKHHPTIDNENENDYAGAYAVAKFKGGGYQFCVLGRKKLDRIKRASKSAGTSYSPWNTEPVEMAKKSAIRSLFKYLPVSAELVTKLANDNVIKGGPRHDIEQITEHDIINIDYKTEEK